MKVKKTPLRMCISCRQMKDKNDMRRVIKLKDDSFTLNPKASGRGAYVCNNDECMNLCLKKRMLNRAFKMNISDEVYSKLLEEYNGSKQN